MLRTAYLRLAPRFGRPWAWCVACVLLWGVVALFPLPVNDLDMFFWPSARAVLGGHPLGVYQPLGAASYPNANGPLAIVPLTAVGVVARALGWLDVIQLRRALALAAFSVFILLMAREAMRSIDRIRQKPLVGPARPVVLLTLTVAPPLWQALGGYGHVEQPIEIWLVLLSLNWSSRARPGSAGVAAGLAILARSSAALFLAPLLVSGWRWGPRRAAAAAAIALGTAAAGLLPFYLADRQDVVHSLFTYRRDLLVGAGSVWSLARGTSWEGLGQHSDLLFVVALGLLLNLWLATRPGGLSGARAYAGLALSAASFALLAKTVWPYYFLEVFVFATVWAVGRGPGVGLVWRVAPPAVVVGLCLFAELGATAGLSLDATKRQGTAMFVLLAVSMVIVAVVETRSTEGLERVSAGT